MVTMSKPAFFCFSCICINKKLMFQKSDDAVVYPIRMLLPHVQFEVDPDALQTTPLLPNPRVYWLCPSDDGYTPHTRLGDRISRK